jgi:hypothetical protein
MSNPKHKQPANPFHPGEILLEEFLEPAGISQARPEFVRPAMQEQKTCP